MEELKVTTNNNNKQVNKFYSTEWGQLHGSNNAVMFYNISYPYPTH